MGFPRFIVVVEEHGRREVVWPDRFTRDAWKPSEFWSGYDEWLDKMLPLCYEELVELGENRGVRVVLYRYKER